MGLYSSVKFVLRFMVSLCLFYMNSVLAVDGSSSVFIVVYIKTADGASNNEKIILGAEQITFDKPIPDGQIIEILAQIQGKPLCKDHDQNSDCVKLESSQNNHFSEYIIPNIPLESSDVYIQKTIVHTYLVDVGIAWPKNDPPSSFLPIDDDNEANIAPIDIMVMDRGDYIYPIFPITIKYKKENQKYYSLLSSLIVGKVTTKHKILTIRKFPDKGLVAIAFENTIHGLAFFENSTLSYSSQTVEIEARSPTLYYVRQDTERYPATNDDIENIPLILSQSESPPDPDTAMVNLQLYPGLPQSDKAEGKASECIKTILNQLVVHTEEQTLYSGQCNNIEYILPQGFKPTYHSLAVFAQQDDDSAPDELKDKITITKGKEHPGPFSGVINPTFMIESCSRGYFATLLNKTEPAGYPDDYEFTGIKSSYFSIAQKSVHSPVAGNSTLPITVTRVLSVYPYSMAADRLARKAESFQFQQIPVQPPNLRGRNNSRVPTTTDKENITLPRSLFTQMREEDCVFDDDGSQLASYFDNLLDPTFVWQKQL